VGIVPHDGVIDQEAKLLAAKADVVIVAVGFDPETESEGADRTFRLPLGQEQLIQEMRAINKNVVVVITAGGAVDMKPLGLTALRRPCRPGIRVRREARRWRKSSLER